MGLKMDLKRILTTVFGIPIVILVFLYCNKYIIGGVILIQDDEGNEFVWIPVSNINGDNNASNNQNDENLIKFLVFSIRFIMLLLFLQVILTEMKTTFKDVAYTLLGILYIPFFLMFLELIRCMEHGKTLLALCFVIAWATDIFAYLVGRFFGKHTFSKISPKKTIEGSVAGIIASIIISLIYLFIANKFWGIEYSYLSISIISIVLSIISQIGDFVASTIKRFVDIKDYGNLLPGHGGMLDRIDSLIFLTPFAYIIFSVWL